jgi:hypothetical protein
MNASLKTETMMNGNSAISRASKMAYCALALCLAALFIKSHHMALAVAQPMVNSMAYTASVTDWLQDERRLLMLIFACGATPLVIFYGVMLCRSLVSGTVAWPSAIASLLSMAALFAMSWLGSFAFFLLPLPLLALVFSVVQMVKRPSLLLEMSVLAEVVTLSILSCYSIWWFAVFVE